MADLPTELWRSIFKHLHDLVDLYSCALVCKALYLEVKKYRIQELAFTHQIDEWSHWFHETTAIGDHKHRADFTMISILKRSSFNFDYLKRLKIDQLSLIEIDDINCFVHLEELDINLAYYKKKFRPTLSLANLRVLHVFVPARDLRLKLDTPRLAKVCTFNLRKLEFFYPESVRCIHTFHHVRELSTFRNLEYLLFTDYYGTLDYTSPSLEQFSVDALEKLKEVHFNYRGSEFEGNMRALKRLTTNLLALRRPDLKVFWMNVQVSDPDLLTEYEDMYPGLGKSDGNRIAFQLQHYEKLKDRIDFFPFYEFNESMEQLTAFGFDLESEEFISKFLTAFSCRRMMIRTEVVESELLLELIASSPNLSSLEFIDSGLGQPFFNRMADIIRLNGIPLRTLCLMNFHSNESLNFEFVCRLYQLEKFRTNLQVSNELVSKLLQLLRLTEIEFNSAGISKRIWRSRGKYHLGGESLSLPQLLERFN